jgi:hypothetical protein
MCLFLASLPFAPVRNFLFPPDGDPGYPVYCIAEPYRSPVEEPGKLRVDFFIINRTSEDLTHDDLEYRLRSGQVPPDDTRSPDVTLRLNRIVGWFEKPSTEDDFNHGKGELTVHIEKDKVRIGIQYLKSRAIMKVTMVVAGLPEIETGGSVSRVDKGSLPFEYEKFQMACHDR